MKTFAALVAFLSLAATSLLAQENKTNDTVRIPAAQAKDHIGAQAVVTGKIAEVNIAEKLVRLNFEKPFPAHVFQAVIFAANTNLFPDVAKLNGKTVEVSGKIAAYRERPQIVLTSTNQLKVVEAVAGHTPASKP
jgi:hypothetical protein